MAALHKKTAKTRAPERRRYRLRALSPLQRKFVEIKTNFPWPSYAAAAREAGYSESVARRAAWIIGRAPAVAAALDAARARGDY